MTHEAKRDIPLSRILANAQKVGPDKLSNLGNLFHTRFDRLGEVEDINRAIACEIQAVALTPEGHVDRPRRLSALGLSYLKRFMRLGELEDIDKAIEYQSQLASSTLNEHAERWSWLNNLATSYQCRFEHSGNLLDITKAIEHLSMALSLIPEAHHNKPSLLNNLGNSYLYQFTRLGNINDISEAIGYQSKAVELCPDGNKNKPGWLSNLGTSHRTRFSRLGEPQDIDRAINYQAQAVLLLPQGHADKPSLLNSLGTSHRQRFEFLEQPQDIDKAIEYQGQAVSLTPDGYAEKALRLNNLGNSYSTRFSYAGRLHDIDKAIHLLYQAVSFTPDGHTNKPSWLHNLSVAHLDRYKRLGDFEDLNSAITYQSEAVILIPEKHPARPELLISLGNSYQRRFDLLKHVEDIHEAIAHQTQAVSVAPERHAETPRWLNHLGISYRRRFEHLDTIGDLDLAISCHTQALSLTTDGNARKPVLLGSLGNAYMRHFERFGDLKSVEEAIACHRDAVAAIPDGHYTFALAHKNLGGSCYRRFEHVGDSVTLRESLQHFQQAAESLTGDPHVRFEAARHWASFSMLHAKNFSIAAYKRAIELIPEIVWLGATVDRRYENIILIGDLVTESAADAISMQEYDRALEWLEEGRSIVWNQTLKLRTPFDDLSAINPSLAERLQQVAHKITKAGSRENESPHLPTNKLSIELAAQQHRRLADRWEQLLAEVRSLPGFGNFMRPRRAIDLFQAAHSGTVVMLNIHKSRCDALAITPGSSTVLHIPLPSFSFEKAVHTRAVFLKELQHSGLRERNEIERRPVRRTNKSNSGFGTVLATLWEHIVKHVLNALGFLVLLPSGNAQLPHVIWCATGPLTFLPLHAAGIYEGAEMAKTFNYVVSSYSPTISALLPGSSLAWEKPSGILAVGQSETKGCAPLPGTIEELAHIKEQAQELRYSQLEGDQATTKSVLDAMESHSWVHLACHAMQDRTEPTKSGFHLHDGILDLGAITRMQLKSKGLAFLSACQTAAGDEKLPDEAVHLAAGMLMAGYSGVVATMWSIKDEDAPLIAKKVYGRLLKDGQMNTDGAAQALHTAVADLRETVTEKAFERWVPFIYLGA